MAEKVEIHMGFGKVAVGEASHPEDKTPGIIYLPIRGEQREHGADCGDIFPPGSEQTDYLAVIYFHSPEVLQQTMDVLQEIKTRKGW